MRIPTIVSIARSRSLSVAVVTLIAATAAAVTPSFGQSGSDSRPPAAPPVGGFGFGNQGSNNQGSNNQGSGAIGSDNRASGSEQKGSGSADKSSGSASRGSGSASQGSGSASQGSGSAGKPGVPVALRGYCAVAIVDTGQWVKGSPQFASVVDGMAYHFINARAKAIFDADPTTYVPGLGGDDIVTFATMGRREPGSLIHGAKHGNRVYFFANVANKQRFMASPAAAQSFAAADLALGGDCAVCRVDLQQAMPGRPDTTLIHQGLRFQFVGREQQQKFLSAPGRYAAAANAARPAAGSSTHGSADQGSTASGSRSAGSGNAGSGFQPAQPPGSGSQGSGSQGR